ncbi:MAG: hypothetical protein ILA34_01085 [Bacteroidaceae bacterium]|nr:hypothetical protein [Bacteroidaceae bacterium]
MKKVFLFVLALIGIATAQADGYAYPYLTFEGTQGATSLAVESITFTIQDGKLLVANGVSTQTFTLSDLSKMYFSKNDVTAIPAVSTDAQPDARREYFDLQGRRVDNPGKGIYIVKQNGRIQKIAIR